MAFQREQYLGNTLDDDDNDSTIIATSDRVLPEVFAIFDRYEVATGAKLNVC